MNPILKGTIAFGTVVGTGGASYGIYSAMQPDPEKVKTYSEELKGTLLSTVGTTDQSKWEARLASMKGLQDANSLVKDLKDIKAKGNHDAKWEDLRDWCVKVINNKNQRGQEFDNVQNYCTFSIKEKIPNAVEEGNARDEKAKWTVAYTKLEGINDDLNDELIAAKAKKDDSKYTAVKDWCTKAYKKPYKGEDDKDFRNASRICLSK